MLRCFQRSCFCKLSKTAAIKGAKDQVNWEELSYLLEECDLVQTCACVFVCVGQGCYQLCAQQLLSEVVEDNTMLRTKLRVTPLSPAPQPYCYFVYFLSFPLTSFPLSSFSFPFSSHLTLSIYPSICLSTSIFSHLYIYLSIPLSLSWIYLLSHLCLLRKTTTLREQVFFFPAVQLFPVEAIETLCCGLSCRNLSSIPGLNTLNACRTIPVVTDTIISRCAKYFQATRSFLVRSLG